jgi:hypothetical protein
MRRLWMVVSFFVAVAVVRAVAGAANVSFLAVVLLWILPVYVAAAQGRGKGRVGWPWGLLLGWLGVIVLAFLPGLPQNENDAPPTRGGARI